MNVVLSGSITYLCSYWDSCAHLCIKNVQQCETEKGTLCVCMCHVRVSEDNFGDKFERDHTCSTSFHKNKIKCSTGR